MHLNPRLPRPRRFRQLVEAGSAIALLLALDGMSGAAIVRRAAGIPENAQGLEGFVNAANALVSPALVAMAAIAPLGCLVGAGSLMFGSRGG
jgi:hypothetical protein